MEPTFEKLLGLLAEGEVRFVLVGGVAVTLHGYVRLTEDVDILIERKPQNIARFLGTLAEFLERLPGFPQTDGGQRIDGGGGLQASPVAPVEMGSEDVRRAVICGRNRRCRVPQVFNRARICRVKGTVE